MIAADRPVQRAPQAQLLYIDAVGRMRSMLRADFAQVLQPGDLLVANDAATLPASLHGIHVASGTAIEVRLAGRRSLAPDDVRCFVAVVFGAGDHRARTEERPPPPALEPGQRLQLGALTAVIEQLLDHPRLVALRFAATPDAIWRALAMQGKPIQYAHLQAPLQLWDVWTAIAGPPVAYEPPSAGFVLDWQLLSDLKSRGIGFSTLTHAAGISSTGDAELDRRLPFDEPYSIPRGTAAALRDARRVIAIGTTVVRALEHSAAFRGVVAAGPGVADQRLGPHSRLRIVDAILSGTHEPGSSHYNLLHAFADAAVLRRADRELNRAGFRTHEFGDSVLIERASDKYSSVAEAQPAKEIPVSNARAGRGEPATYTPRFLRTGRHVVQESPRLSPACRLVDCGG